MTDSQEHVNLQLIDAGDHADRVMMVLSKVKGLTMTPEESVQSTPCTIARDVPQQLAEKLQVFLEQAGATVSLGQEQEEEEEAFLLIDDADDTFDVDDSGEKELELDVIAETGGGDELELDIVAEESSDNEFELDIVAEENSGDELEFDSAGDDLDLFSPDALPAAEDVREPPELPMDEVEPASDDWTFDDSPMPDDDSAGDVEGPSEDFGGFSAADTGAIPDVEESDLFGEEDLEFSDLSEDLDADQDPQPKAGSFQNLLSRLPKGKSKGRHSEEEYTFREDEPEKKSGKAFKMPALPKFRKNTRQVAASDESFEDLADSEEQIETIEEREEKKALALPGGSVLASAMIGFLIGALLAGTWGWFSSSAARRDANRQLEAYRQQLTSQNQNQGQELEAKVEQQSQEIEALTAQNAELRQQLASSPSPQSITPSAVPVNGQTPVLNALVTSFEELKNRHLQSLEQSLETRQKGACTEQVLLDGEGTLTFAQVIKQFSTKYTTFDIMRSNSLVTPYIAELKVPFQQEVRTGSSESQCNNAKSFRILTPPHHEFGTYYGYWIVQYVYQDGKWLVKPTVIEKNRALYEKSFKIGSPDHAKFLIDTTLFPELQN